MLLQELQIEGFRSLKSVTWKPGRLNVLIGPNGGGKSNLLRALDLLRIAATGGLDEAVIGMGGMAPLVWDGQATRIRLTVYAGDPVVPNSRFQIIMNRLGNTGGLAVESEAPRRGTRALRNHVKGWSVHNDMQVDQKAELRRAIVTRSERRVNPDGQNLIAVLHTLYTNDRNFEEFLDKAMSAAFPDDYDKLIFPPAEHGRTEMRVRRKHRKGTDSPADLSDGTLRFLLLVTILGSTAKQEMERRVSHDHFRQHFAVHETEAWLLSDLNVFPREIQGDLPRTSRPESINHQHPPGHRLKDIYWRRLNRKYKKPIEGTSLFRKLDPETAYQCCAHLRLLLDDVLSLATGSLV
jgi:predicted ATPase